MTSLVTIYLFTFFTIRDYGEDKQIIYLTRLPIGLIAMLFTTI